MSVSLPFPQLFILLWRSLLDCSLPIAALSGHPLLIFIHFRNLCLNFFISTVFLQFDFHHRLEAGTSFIIIKLDLFVPKFVRLTDQQISWLHGYNFDALMHYASWIMFIIQKFYLYSWRTSSESVLMTIEYSFFNFLDCGALTFHIWLSKIINGDSRLELSNFWSFQISVRVLVIILFSTKLIMVGPIRSREKNNAVLCKTASKEHHKGGYESLWGCGQIISFQNSWIRTQTKIMILQMTTPPQFSLLALSYRKPGCKLDTISDWQVAAGRIQ